MGQAKLPDLTRGRPGHGFLEIRGGTSADWGRIGDQMWRHLVAIWARYSKKVGNRTGVARFKKKSKNQAPQMWRHLVAIWSPFGRHVCPLGQARCSMQQFRCGVCSSRNGLRIRESSVAQRCSLHFSSQDAAITNKSAFN